jgi:hypothetical protein
LYEGLLTLIHHDQYIQVTADTPVAAGIRARITDPAYVGVMLTDFCGPLAHGSIDVLLIGPFEDGRK